tara:strand:+ start:20 stop:1123 length:1104 start_codon:yes stop_codon:yes gene_type:complete
MSTNQNKYKDKSFFMNLALIQAKKNLGNTSENPSVGCVITKNNHLISAGNTSFKGRPHAELNAINFSRTSLKGSDLYVTLEPCSHFGRTPPCTKSIINKKINKVFFSIIDPDIRSKNKCKKVLKKKGIFSRGGLCKNNLNFFYRSYIKSKRDVLPFVTSKLALSKDLFTIDKKRKWITNDFSRGRVHLLRAEHDCLITSSNTVIKDNPRLTCRIDGLKERTPARIILDKSLKTPLSSILIKNSIKYQTIIFYNKYKKDKIKMLKKLKVNCFKVSLDKDKNMDLKKALILAKRLGFYRIFLETGLKLTTVFLKNNLVDDLKLFISDKKLGSRGKGSFKRYLNSSLRNKKSTIENVNLFGEKLINYKIK